MQATAGLEIDEVEVKKKVRVKVRCEMRTVRETAIAVFVGKYTEHYDEKWIWLPRSMVTWTYANQKIRRSCLVDMPEWLAKDRGIR